MNPSTALATVLVDELVRGGVTEAVLCPGSRSAPLAYALHAADATGRLRLHVRVDERSAGFLALGLAKASDVPVPVVTTSGTAVANLHPAVLEAHHAGVPLLVLSADRPADLQGTGANQTIEQGGLYGAAVRLAVSVPPAEGRPGEVATWRAVVCRLLAAAAGELDGDPGPVHADVPLREPLIPDRDEGWVEPLDGRADGGPWTTVSLPPPSWGGPLDGDRALGSGLARTLVVVGDCPPDMAARGAELARRRGWPLVAEPPAALTHGSALPHGVLLLGCAAFVAAHRPQRVLVVGRPTVARAVQQLLADPRVVVEVVAASPRWADPPRQARAVHHRGWLEAALREARAAPAGVEDVPGAGWAPEAAPPDRAWGEAWRRAAQALVDPVAAEVEGSWPSGPAVARCLVETLPPGALLVLGASNVVRDVDVATAPRTGLTVLANRGLAGIDGTVSSAVGAALAVQRDVRGRATGVPAFCLLGDLAFLHDANGLLLGPDEPRPDLTLVVLNDDGGGIFGLLEQGAVEHRAAFERVFGTPQGVDLAALCSATGTAYTRAETAAALRSAVRPAPGVRVVEVAVDRAGQRARRDRLRARVDAVLGS